MRTRRRWFVALAAIASVTLVFLAVGAIFCNAALRVKRQPIRNPPVFTSLHRRVTAASVSISARDASRLEAWFIDSGGSPKKCVIVLHGIADSRRGSAGFAPIFLDQGYSVLVPDARAHGTSGGDIVTYGVLEKYDVLDWAAWLRTAGCTRIYGLGESLGAATLIQACSVAPVFQAVVAESSYSDLRSIAEYRARRFAGLSGSAAVIASRWLIGGGMFLARLRYGLDLAQASPRAAISRAQTPILLVHGLEDEQTPLAHSQAIAAANPAAALWLVPGAGHTSAAAVAPEEFRRRVLGWFASH